VRNEAFLSSGTKETQPSTDPKIKRKKLLKNKRILVTGACGTVGSELVKQLLDGRHQIAGLVALDNNESDLFFLEQRFLRDKRACFYLADVRDRDKLTRMMRGVAIVFHAAAFKHVVLCERSPFEAVQSNINGVHNVILAANDCDVEKVIFTSTDKAVNPTSVMGTSKLMGEKIMTAANSNQTLKKTIFASTRFGNVLGSRGSVIPIFNAQIKNGGPVTVTDPAMTRFIMTIKEAVHLIIDSASLARGGEVFITKMPIIKIQDLAEVMIEELASDYGYNPADISIETIGSKPGEKLYEELMSHEEIRRSVELPDYFSVLPAFRGIYRDIEYRYPDIVTETVTNPYISADELPLSKEDLRSFLFANDLLLTTKIEDHPDRRYWPGEKEK